MGRERVQGGALVGDWVPRGRWHWLSWTRHPAARGAGRSAGRPAAAPGALQAAWDQGPGGPAAGRAGAAARATASTAAGGGRQAPQAGAAQVRPGAVLGGVQGSGWTPCPGPLLVPGLVPEPLFPWPPIPSPRGPCALPSARLTQTPAPRPQVPGPRHRRAAQLRAARLTQDPEGMCHPRRHAVGSPVPSDDTHPCSPCPSGAVGDTTAAPGWAGWAAAWG